MHYYSVSIDEFYSPRSISTSLLVLISLIVWPHSFSLANLSFHACKLTYIHMEGKFLDLTNSRILATNY